MQAQVESLRQHVQPGEGRTSGRPRIVGQGGHLVSEADKSHHLRRAVHAGLLCPRLKERLRGVDGGPEGLAAVEVGSGPVRDLVGDEPIPVPIGLRERNVGNRGHLRLERVRLVGV